VAFKDCILIINQKSKENMPSSARIGKFAIEVFEEKYV